MGVLVKRDRALHCFVAIVGSSSQLASLAISFEVLRMHLDVVGDVVDEQNERA
jgi:hypothetical protein